MPRLTWRAVALKGTLAVLSVCAVSAIVEQVLERRDAAQFTAGETFYAAQGRRTRYLRTGPNAPGPTIVLLNGGVASLEQWDSVQSALSKTAPVISYDRGGFGFSDPANGYDANAGADELYQLLQYLEKGGPIVLVCYSSSAMMATVFTAQHPDVVKGIVFVDPTVRSRAPGTKTYRRIFWRLVIISPLEAFFGYTRLAHALSSGNSPPSSPVSERWQAVIESSHHMLATAHDVMSLDQSADETDAAMATRPFADLPLGVLTTAAPASGDQSRFDRHAQILKSSKRGVMRSIHGDHSQLLNDPTAVASLVDLIQTIAVEARRDTAAKAGAGLP